MSRPPLARIVTRTGRRAPSPAAVAALTTALIDALGSTSVSTVESQRRAASTDFAHLSPILSTVLPARPADVVCRPRSAAELTTAVRLAYEHRVPVTARGAGTGNYGQAVPLAAGLVIDLSRADQILEIGPGWIRAQAGATFVALEAAARRTGQELAMFPTTVGSTLGGFLAGGAGGVGSLAHGWLWDEYALSLEVVTCPPANAPLTVPGPECRPYLHAYGVTGIIAAATVRLVPAQKWVGLLASFPNAAGATVARTGLALARLDPVPRLISVDQPALVELYPADPAMPADRYSLRAIIGAGSVAAAHTAVLSAGGRIEEVRAEGAGYLATLGFNHVTLRARRARPSLCHLQVGGEALITRTAEVTAALPGGMLHLDALRVAADPTDPTAGRHYGGLLLSEFVNAETLYAGVERLRAIGVQVVDPHTWQLGGPALAEIAAVAARNDPAGLLNPGKLP